MVERILGKDEVTSSILVISSIIYGGIAQLARASGSYPLCPRFKSVCRHHLKIRLMQFFAWAFLYRVSGSADQIIFKRMNSFGQCFLKYLQIYWQKKVTVVLSFSDNLVCCILEFERGGKNACVDYFSLHRMQAEELSDQQKQKERSWPYWD